MSNPYSDMTKRKVVPVEKWSILLQAAAAIGTAEQNNERGDPTCDPERAKALLRKVFGEENFKHIEVKSSNVYSPVFEIDGISLLFFQGRQAFDDYFVAAYGGQDDNDLPIRSLADLGAALLYYVGRIPCNLIFNG